MLIRKEYFSLYIQFTLNVPDSNVLPYIINSENHDIIPTIGRKMYDDLRLIYDTNPSEWNATTNYSAGEYAVVLNGTVYEVFKSLIANTNINPIGNPSVWQLSELGTAFENYIKPFATLCCVREFLTFHGVNITQFGLRVMEETTSYAADGSTRQNMINHIRQRIEAYRASMLNYFCDKSWTFDNVQYKPDCDNYKKGNRVQINAI